jgi:hypothetical protein
VETYTRTLLVRTLVSELCAAATLTGSTCKERYRAGATHERVNECISSAVARALIRLRPCARTLCMYSQQALVRVCSATCCCIVGLAKNAS